MMNRTELTQGILWLDQLAVAAKAEATKLRDMLTADARAEFVEQGTAPTWRIPDVATIAASVSHESVHVSDDAAFTAWVAERYPTEVETVTRVRGAWLTGFLTRTRVHGDDPEDMIAADGETGEVVPGVTVRAGGQFAGISIRATADAKAVFGALARTGLERLALDSGPAVPVVVAEVPDVVA